MFGLFSRSRRSAPPVKPSSFRPTLERLEERDCPSTIMLFISGYAPNKQVTLTGVVSAGPGSPSGLGAGGLTTGSNGTPANPGNPMGVGTTPPTAWSPAGLTVQLTGAASGTATTDANGNFSVTLTATALATIYASTTDGLSNTASVLLADVAPTISNFAFTEDSSNLYVFSGTVTGNNAGEVVTLGGMVAATDGQVLPVSSTGYFSLAIQLTGASNDGSITAQATDWWGLTSNLAETWVG
jgi:hypothetical protein